MGCKRFSRAILLAFAFLLASAPPALADQIDQSFSGINNVSFGCPCVLAQTFTAGLTGTLTGVNVQIDASGATSLALYIVATSAGTPSSIILGQTSLSAGNYTFTTLFTFPSMISVVAGTQYAIAVGASGGTLIWTYSPTGGYAGGTAFDASGTSDPSSANWLPLVVFAPADLNFQTRVEPIPEPGSVLLVATGLASLLARRRRLS